MTATAKHITLPNPIEFEALLDTVDLLTRAKILQQLNELVYPSLIGCQRHYFCMDGKRSPLYIAAERIRKAEVLPYRLLCEFFRKDILTLSTYPLFLQLLETPVGFINEGHMLSYDKTPTKQLDQATSAHQVCAFILLNEHAAVTFDLGAKTAYQGTNGEVRLTRKNKTVVVNNNVNGLHSSETVISLHRMRDYRQLFTAVMMAFSEATY